MTYRAASKRAAREREMRPLVREGRYYARVMADLDSIRVDLEAARAEADAIRAELGLDVTTP